MPSPASRRPTESKSITTGEVHRHDHQRTDHRVAPYRADPLWRKDLGDAFNSHQAAGPRCADSQGVRSGFWHGRNHRLHGEALTHADARGATAPSDQRQRHHLRNGRQLEPWMDAPGCARPGDPHFLQPPLRRSNLGDTGRCCARSACSSRPFVAQSVRSATRVPQVTVARKPRDCQVGRVPSKGRGQ